MTTCGARSSASLLLGSVMAVAAISCNSGPPPPMPQDEPLATARRSDSIAVRVFLDGTASMRGFARGTPTQYATALGALERAISSQWPAASVVFLQFGARVVTVSGSTHLFAVQPEFYDDTSVNRETRLELVFDSIAGADLSAIVTDLYQQNADVNRVAREITRRFLRQGAAVGVIGMRSAFEGVVYDVGIEGSSYPYRGARPFYLVILGPRSLVEHTIDRFHQELRNDGQLNGSDATTLVLSNTLVESVGTLPRADTTSGVNTRHGLVQGGDSLHLLQFSFYADTALIRIVAPWRRARWSVDFDTGAVETRTTTWFWDRKAAAHAPPSPGDGHAARQPTHDSVPNASPGGRGRWIPDTRSPDWATASAIPAAGSLSVTVRLRRTEIACGVHAVSLAIGPEPRNLRLPEWVGAWNLPNAAIGPQAGARTLNLSHLLSSLLYGGFTASEAPALASFRVYVEKPCGLFGE